MKTLNQASHENGSRTFSSIENYSGLFSSFLTIVIITGFIFIILFAHFLLTEFLWAGWTFSKNTYTYSLSELGYGNGVIDARWNYLVPYDHPGELVLTYIPQDNNSDYSIQVMANTAEIRLVYPADSVPTSNVLITFPEEKSSQKVMLVSQPEGWNWRMFYKEANLHLGIIDRNAINHPMVSLPLYIETPLISFLRQKQTGVFKDSPLLLLISALVWLGSVYLKIRQHLKERSAEFIAKVRTHFREVDVEKARYLLEDKRNFINRLFSNNQDLAHASLLIDLPKRIIGEHPLNIKIDEDWADETAGVVLSAIQLSPEADDEKIYFLNLLGRFPSNKCSPDVWDKIIEKKEDLGSKHPSLPILWPISPSMQLDIDKKIPIHDQYFYNPYISPKAEFEEKRLFCSKNPLYWPKLPLHDRINDNRLPIIAMIGSDGSGKSALGLAWSINAPLDDSIGVYLSGCPNVNSIFQEMTEQLFRFICVNPAHLCLLDSLHREHLSALLSGTLGVIPVYGRLERAVKAHRNKNPNPIEVEMQWDLFRRTLNTSPPSINPVKWFPILEEICFASNFKYARLVFDIDPEMKLEAFNRLMVTSRSLFKILNHQTMLLINTSQYQKWSQAGYRIEKFGGPVNEICWRDDNHNFLDDMLKYRWGVYNETIRLEEIIEINGVYQELLSRAEDNPAEFIRLWCEHFRL